MSIGVRPRIRNFRSWKTGGVADVVAPTLSVPTDTETGATTATLTVDTNEGSGTLYWVLSSAVTTPSAAQVKLGHDHTGGAALDSGTAAVSVVGTQTVAVTGLTASTTYYAHFMHEDAATNQSTVASGNGFTTEAALGFSPSLDFSDDRNSQYLPVAA